MNISHLCDYIYTFSLVYLYFFLMSSEWIFIIFYTFQTKMYKARTVFNRLAPLAPRICGPERYASWVVRSHPLTRISQVIFTESVRKYNSRAATEPFLNGSTSSYVEEMYNAWLQDPHSVHIVSKSEYIAVQIFMWDFP